MLPSIEEIFAIDREYLQRNRSLPVSVSDWHLTDAVYDLPNIPHFRAASENSYGLSDYLFSDSRGSEKRIVLNYIERRLGLDASRFSVSVFTNATAALFSLLAHLTSGRDARVLVQTPFYFSIAGALRFCSAHGVMFHVRADDNYSFDADAFVRMVDDQAIDIAILTDPMYCTGIRNTEKVLLAIAALADRNVICLIDSSAGGFEAANRIPIIEPLYVDAVSRFKNVFYIDSPTKRMLINSAKHALIFGDPATLEKVEGLADHFAGSLTREQLIVLAHVFSDEAWPSITAACHSNAVRLARGLAFVSAACSEHDVLAVSPREAGLYALVDRSDVRQRKLSASAFYKAMLTQSEVRALPGHLFGVSNSDRMAIRINLFRHPSIIDKAIAAFSKLDVEPA
jgi:aspartate/methionine/tyrosine aminotransferase